MLLGLHGKLGSGKDTVLERLQVISPKFTRFSFADKLKDSACVMLGINRDMMELLKRDADAAKLRGGDPAHRIKVEHFSGGEWGTLSCVDMRDYLQLYGTESHRDIFGPTFWVDQSLAPALVASEQGGISTYTDCRFPSEAEAILQHGGVVWEILGPESNTGQHSSEVRLPEEMISRVIDNTVRADGFSHLDRQLHILVNELLEPT